MRRHHVLLLILVLLVGLALSARPIIVSAVKKELLKSFPDSVVTVAGCEFSLTQLAFSGIEIKKAHSHDFKVSRLVVEFEMLALLHGKVHAISVDEGQINIDLVKQTVLNLPKVFLPKGSSPKSPFAIEKISLNHLQFNIHTKDLKADFSVSLDFAMDKQILHAIEIQLNSLEFQDLVLKNALLKVTEQEPGNFHMDSFQYNKLKVTNLGSRVILDQEKLVFPNLSGTTLNGKISGELVLGNNPLIDYKFNIHVENLDVQVFIHEFEFEKTFTMPGLMSGDVALAGKGPGVKILSGNISLGEKGGVLVIKDTRFLETVAKNSNLPPDLVVDSFKNYNYNTGIVALSLDQGNVGVEISLDGKAGKQKFNFIFHDLF